MPPAAPVPVSKQDFQGDVLDREFKILRNAKTGEYMFDYVEITPNVKKALDTIQYYRLKSTKLSDIEAAVKARSKGTSSAAPAASSGPSPTNNGYIPISNNNNNNGSSTSGSTNTTGNRNTGTGPKTGNAFAETLNANNAAKQKKKQEQLGESLLGLFAGMNVKPLEEISPESTESYQPPKVKLTTQEQDDAYCDAKETLEKLAKGVKISANSEKRYRNLVASYTENFNNPENIPACESRVAPPPTPTATLTSSAKQVVTEFPKEWTSTTAKASGGRRKTKKAKKFKRKTHKRKH